MKRFHLFALAAALASALAVPATAADKMSSMSMEASAGAKIGHATGVITAVDETAKTVTIKHGPIAAVGWPAMTMTFKANPASLVQKAKVGEKIAFDVKVQGQSNEVTAIHKP